MVLSMDSPAIEYQRDTLQPRDVPQIQIEIALSHTPFMNVCEKSKLNNNSNVLRNKSEQVYKHDLFSFSENIAPGVIDLSSTTLTSA